MTIFQKSVINRHLNNLDKEQVEKVYKKFRENYSPAKIEEIKKLKEEEYQDGFLRGIFVDVFGYTLKPDFNYNLAREFKNQGDGKKADGAILNNEKAVAVIELKSTKTKDLKSITEQAFNYKNNQPECKYVITSNFQKLRFYIDYAHEYEEFDLFNLQKEDFELLYMLLNANSIFSDLPLKLKEETKFHEQEVSDKLYKDYSIFKRKLFENLIKHNPDSDKLTLFNKSQKLLDRFLFILFAEDSGLLPPNSISRIIDTFHKLTELDAYKPIYDIYKQYFGYMNIGRKGKTNADNIPAYNGGLFYTDELLDNLKIDDSILIDDLLKLSEYDFNTEVDVNILGHIFEHSLSEIEEITAEIEGATIDKTKSKRKKDGVFYTPKYITQYIVENTIGTLCNKKRKELEIEEIEFDGSYRAKDGKLLTKGKKLYQKLNNYKEWLLSLKIVDPACGSGAFLNQALNFLIEEHKNIDDIIAELTNTALRLFDTDKAILENNLYGVDINEESVEIAKLSLWLRTAQKGRKLSSLNDNIKCGNSLIDDPEIAGEKAFNWNTEFKEIMDNGGFDVVIGNPPYVDNRGFDKTALRYLYEAFPNSFEKSGTDHHKTTKLNLIAPFIELNKKLLKNNGLTSYIFHKNIFKTNSYTSIRKFILMNFDIVLLTDWGAGQFKDVIAETATFTLRKGSVLNNHINVEFFSFSKKTKENSQLQSVFINSDAYIFGIYASLDDRKLLKLIEANSKFLKNYVNINNGIVTGNDKFYLSNNKINESYKKVVRGKNIKRYNHFLESEYVLYDKDKLLRARNENIFKAKEKLIMQMINIDFVLTFDNNQYYNLGTTYAITNKSNLSIKFLLSVLNSTLINYYYKKKFTNDSSLTNAISTQNLFNVPVKEISENRQQPFIVKADKMLDLNKVLQEKKNKFTNRINDNFEINKISKKLELFYNYDFKTFVSELKKQKIKLSLVQQDEWEEYFNAYKDEINQLQDEINTTDKEIDQMVYELYGLTEEEIGIVEKSGK